MEIDVLVRFNAWWRDGKVSEGLRRPYRRRMFAEIQKYMGMRQIVLVYGLRRVGKSTILYQMIDDLLRTVDQRRVLYFSFDDRRYGLDEVMDAYQQTVLHSTFEELRERVYLFLDEVQKIDDWESRIKVYYDLYPNLKFIVSGSASIALRKAAKESLAGRIFDFALGPLGFDEFLEMQGVDVEKVLGAQDIWRRSVLPLFDRYLKYGSFPELVGVEDDEVARRYINEDVIEKIVYKDLPESFDIKDIGLLKALVVMVAENPGMVIDFASIARDLHRDQRTIANYFEYLEFGMIVKFLLNFRGSPIASRRKLKKAYLATPNISFASGRSLDLLMPGMRENQVLEVSGADFFYKNSFEVDFIAQKEGKIVGIEVKSSDADTAQLAKLRGKFGSKVVGLVLVTEGEGGESKGITTIPLWRYCLSKGTDIAKVDKKGA